MKKPTITILGLCGNSAFLTIDHFHVPGETVHADSLHMEPGGKGYNQAVAAARLGANVHFLSACGEDREGETCESFLISENITPHFLRSPDQSTAFASILTDCHGENQVTVYRGAADLLSADYICTQEPVIAESDILLLNLEVPMVANLAALDLAEKHGVKAILNPAPAIPCDEQFLRRFFCLTPNQSEAKILQWHAGTLVTTLGSEGCELSVSGSPPIRIPAVSVNAIDTTGAGDCFTAALAVFLAEGHTLAEAAEFAVRAAAISVTRHFVMPALPYRRELIS